MTCIDNNFKFINIFIPTINDFKLVCYSHNKTYLFIQALLRSMLYLLIIYSMYIYLKINLIIILILLFLIMFNLIYVIFKKQSYTKFNINTPTVVKPHIPTRTPIDVSKQYKTPNKQLYDFSEINNERKDDVIYSVSGGFLNTETGEYLDLLTGSGKPTHTIILNESQQSDPRYKSFI